MTPYEVNLVIEANRPKYTGGIHEDDIDRMMERRNELAASGMELL